MVSRHTHTCTLVSLHSNSIWKSDGIRGVYVDVCVYVPGAIFSFSLLAFSVHWERAQLIIMCRLCVGVCVCKHKGLMFAFHHSSSGEKSDPCSAELNLNARTDTQSIRKREHRYRPLYLYDLHACVKRLRRPAAISVKVQRYEIENENSKKKKEKTDKKMKRRAKRETGSAN